MQLGKPGKRHVGIDLAPLVDVVFLLVIFFAVSTTFLESSGIKLDLPSSSSTADREVREVTVFMAVDGTLSFDGRTLTLEQLRAQLPDALASAERKIVVLRADTAAPHGSVVRVMDAVREAGAEGLTIATRPAGE